MSVDLRANLTRGSTWIRGLYMLLFAILFNVGELVLAAVAVFQFLAHLITGGVNSRLQGFGDNLAAYLRETAAFLTYSAEHKPFPFGAWPGSAETEAEEPGPMGPGTAPKEASSPDADDPEEEPNESGIR